MAEVEMGLIYKVAESFRRDDLDMDDLIGEASLAYAKALKSYDPEGPAKLSTWCYTYMKNQLINYLKCPKSQVGSGSYEFGNEELVDEIDAEQRLSFMDEISALGPKVSELCEMLFENPEEFLTTNRTETRAKIWNKLRERGWNWRIIKKSYRQLTAALTQPLGV